jgi:hypothetical protein
LAHRVSGSGFGSAHLFNAFFAAREQYARLTGAWLFYLWHPSFPFL